MKFLSFIFSPVLMENPPYVWVFHNSYAEWLVDVKHCTRRFLCDLADGAGSLAMWMSLKAVEDQADYG